LVDSENAELVFKRFNERDIIEFTSLDQSLVDFVPEKRVDLLALEVVSLNRRATITGRSLPRE
jgi:hypothetical protein